VFCAHELVQLRSVVFCVVRTAHEFDFRLVINEHLTNGDQRPGHAVTEIHVCDRIYLFSPDRLSDCYGSLPMLCRSAAFS
jgi:hypothetical protein